MTPLMHAVKDNRTPILDRLIDLGSDVGARNNVSITPWENVLCGVIIFIHDLALEGKINLRHL